MGDTSNQHTLLSFTIPSHQHGAGAWRGRSFYCPRLQAGYRKPRESPVASGFFDNMLFCSQLNFLRLPLQALWPWAVVRWHLGITAGGPCQLPRLAPRPWDRIVESMAEGWIPCSPQGLRQLGLWFPAVCHGVSEGPASWPSVLGTSSRGGRR